MAATLTATPNPVRVWGASGTGTTTIQWNTGIAANGRLYLTTSSDIGVLTPETLFDGDSTLGALSGSKALAVAAGNIYTFSLRRVSNNATLATLVVRVEDLD